MPFRQVFRALPIRFPRRNPAEKHGLRGISSLAQ
jgi:hypothetical protein